MLNTFSGWLFNLILWGSIISLALLLYETFVSRGFLANDINTINAAIGAAVIAVLSLFWPKF